MEFAESQTFDLLISDLGLPDGSGMDLIRQLLTRHAIKAIALSGYGMEEDMAQTKAAGFLRISPSQSTSRSFRRWFGRSFYDPLPNEVEHSIDHRRAQLF